MNEVSLKPVIDELEILFSKFNKASLKESWKSL